MSDYCFKTLQSKLKQYHSPYITNKNVLQKEKFKKRLPLSMSQQNLNYNIHNRSNFEKEKNAYSYINPRRNTNVQRSNPSLLDNQQSSFFDKTIKHGNKSRSNSETDQKDIVHNRNIFKRKSRKFEKLQTTRDKIMQDRMRKFSIDQNLQQQFDPFNKRSRIQNKHNQQSGLHRERHQSFHDFVQNYQGYKSHNYSMRNHNLNYPQQYNYESQIQSPINAPDDHIKIYLQDRLQLAEKELRILQHQNYETVDLLKRRNFEIDSLYNENLMLKNQISNTQFNHERRATLSNKPILNKKFSTLNIDDNEQIVQQIKNNLSKQKLTSSESKLVNFILNKFSNKQIEETNLSMSDIPSEQEIDNEEFNVAQEIQKLADQTKDRGIKKQLKSLKQKIYSMKKVPSSEQNSYIKFQELLKQICLDLEINIDHEEFNQNLGEQNLTMLEEIKNKILESKIPSTKSFRQLNSKKNLLGSFRRQLKKFDDDSLATSMKEDSVVQKKRGVVSPDEEKLKQTIEMLKQEKESMKQMIQKLRQDNQQKLNLAKNKEIEEMKNELEKTNTNLKDKTRMIGLLETDKMNSEKQIKELKEQKDTIEKENQNNQKQIEQLSSELQNQNENYKIMVHQYKEMKQILSDQQEEQNKLTSQKEQIYQYQDSLDKKEKEIDQLKNRLSQTQSENENLRNIAERQINKEFLMQSQPNNIENDQLELVHLSNQSDEDQNNIQSNEQDQSQIEDEMIQKCYTDIDDGQEVKDRIFQSVNFEEQRSNYFCEEDGEEIDLEKVESIIQNIIQENQQIQEELKEKISQLEQTVESQNEKLKSFQIQEQKMKIKKLIKDQNDQSSKELIQKIEKLQKKNDKLLKEKKELKLKVQNLESEIEEYREICEDLSRHKISRQGKQPNQEDIEDLQQRIQQKDKIIKSFADENMIAEEIQNLQEQVEMLKEQFKIKEQEQSSLKREYSKVFQNFKLLKSELLKKEEIIFKLQQDHDQILDESEELLSDEDNDLFSEDEEEDEDDDDEEVEVEMQQNFNNKSSDIEE